MVTAIAPQPKTTNELSSIMLAGDLCIPAGITSLASFRDWAYSDSFPQRGEIDWLAGVLWVDLNMEQAYTHNQAKAEITYVLTGIAKKQNRGLVFPDGMRFTHPAADISCEPDAMFISYAALESGRIREIPGKVTGVIEFEGSPDMVLEVVSASSVGKDTERLLHLYFLAGIQEYWLVDVRGESVDFEIYQRGPEGFVPGTKRSAVFGCSFQLSRDQDRRGNPQYALTVC